jgi:hypothetical protein
VFLRGERYERRASRQGRAKTTEIRAGRDVHGTPGATMLEGAIVPARQVKTASDRARSIWADVGLVAAARVLRSRHSAALVTVSGIVLVAVTQIGGKVLVRVGKDLIAWDNARLADQESQLRRQRLTQAPDGMALEGSVIPPREPAEASRQRAAVLLGVGLVAAARVLRNHRFDEQVIAGIFVLAALSQMGWKELVRALRDLIAWDSERLADLEKELRRQANAKAGRSAAS